MLIIGLDAGITFGAAQLVGQFAPRRMDGDAVGARGAAGRVEVVAHDGRNAHLPRRREQVGRHKSGRQVGGQLAPCGVIEGDQIVGLAATEGSLQAQDGVGLGAFARQAAQGFRQEGLKPGGGVGVLEEAAWILIDGVRITTDHLLQTGGKDFLTQFALKDIVTRLAELKDGG